MGFKFHKMFFSAAVGIALGARLFAAGTNLPVAPEATNGVVAQTDLLQIQEQLHATQLAIEGDLHKIETEAKNNSAAATDSSAALNARIQSLEQTIAAQHAADASTMHRTQQLTLILIVLLGVIGLGIMLLMVYFQWRAFSQLAEIATRQTALAQPANTNALPTVEAVSLLATPGRAAVETSNARLLGAVEKLEKRILELEHEPHPALAPKNLPAEKPEKTETQSVQTNGKLPDAKSQDTMDREECIANLFSEGQSLMNSSEPEKALECFEVALRLFPDHAEALVKKGGALEKLGRLDEAIECYDAAIAADNALTVAYLQKGGLFNRMARYDEALRCYERALQTQESKPA